MNEIELIAKLAKDKGISLSRAAKDGGLSRNGITEPRRLGSSIATRSACNVLGSMGYGLYAAPLDARLDEREDVTRIDGEGND